MKEIEQLPVPEISIEQDVKVRQELTLIGFTYIPKGADMFYFNRKTLQFGKVDRTKANITKIPMSKKILNARTLILQEKVDPIIHSEAKYNPDCWYVVARDEKNAARKFNNIFKKLNIQIQINIKKVKHDVPNK
jgi:hypothetical protein